ncbi:Zn-dependent hydrolase, including glyoxylase [Longilinea arvoryzae]|uniref:Zn-dependent hydrolase, including glyoxylase n=1 Tax=Longilinea arvoryzae TaxID=360412 RepID=A0A0S7BH90_9CHLR|nr:MBL fold metallo-hydrolase [Longilinea arvoryzae]GAP13093.1 Zn-dependent hydrolase, including glyoxylase [Longilinea arvoryzae]
MDNPLAFESRHFRLQALADGVLTAIAANGGWAICNSGLIDLGEQIVIFDTFLTPQAAQDLRWFAVEQYDRTPQFVVNSHYHNDHIWGNQVFAADAQILSSVRTRELIATEGMEELRWNQSNAAQRLESLQTQFQNAGDPRQKQELLLWIGEYEGIVEALPQLKVCLPGVTFDTRLEIHGARRACELVTFEGGHSGSDTILYLPEEGIVFMGDLLFVGAHPFLADGDPQALLIALREVSRLKATCFVPGHGPPGSRADVELLSAYVESCLEIAGRLVDAGKFDEAAIKEVQIPEAFQAWQLAQFYRSNLRFLCKRLSLAENGARDG